MVSSSLKNAPALHALHAPFPSSPVPKHVHVASYWGCTSQLPLEEQSPLQTFCS
jgi:hypothetical protein